MIDQELAVQLCCLEIRYYFKDMPQIALDKKSNFEYLEKEVGLEKFVPKSILSQLKPKQLRKLIQQHFKKVSILSELDCMLQFFDILKQDLRHHVDFEQFRVSLGSSWLVPIDLVIGESFFGAFYQRVAKNYLQRINTENYKYF